MKDGLNRDMILGASKVQWDLQWMMNENIYVHARVDLANKVIYGMVDGRKSRKQDDWMPYADLHDGIPSLEYKVMKPCA